MNQAQYDHAQFMATEGIGSEREDEELPSKPRLIDREDIEAVIACLGDDAAQLHGENPEDERADNMLRAADLLGALAEANYQIARILLDRNREGAKDWARGLHINMDATGFTASADLASPPASPAPAREAQALIHAAQIALAVLEVALDYMPRVGDVDLPKINADMQTAADALRAALSPSSPGAQTKGGV
jgi:hypothetical protein